MVILTLTFSCDILDVAPVSQISSDNFWKTESDATAGAVAMYDGLQEVSRNWVTWGEVRADIFDKTLGNIIGELQEILTNQIPNTNRLTNWNVVYGMINRANLLLANIEAIPMNADLKQQYIGEAHFIRAIGYFVVLKVWGDAPIVTIPYTSVEQDFTIPRNPKSELIQQIEVDIDQAIALLPNQVGTAPTTVRGRANKFAAHALASDFYLWVAQVEGGGAAYFQKAITSTDVILANTATYKLVAGAQYATIFRRNSTEGIFEVQFDFGKNEVQELEGPALLTMPQIYTGINRLQLRGVPGSGTGFVDQIEAGDIRPTVVINAIATAPQTVKYIGTPQPAPSTLVQRDANVILYRLAEIILFKAEALNKLGDQPGAIALLDQIRSRAGLPGTTAVTQEEVKLAILQERKMEFHGEGKRYFDLIRNGEAFNFIDNITDPDNLVWPIHQDELNRNPEISQNEFYGN